MGNTLTADTTKTKKKMELFPYALIRVGGDSFDQWSTMDFPRSNTIIEEIYQLKQQQQQKKELLCDQMFEFISNSDDQDVQNIVQNLRRDIFNERKLKNSKVNKALTALPAELSKVLEEYLTLLKDLKSKEQEGEGDYTEELHEGRRQFKKLVDSEHLKKGLILSSRTLLNRLDSFQKRPVEKFRKKEFQIEQSLLQYLTRMYAKTSPFSTFTNLAVGTLGDVEEGIKLSWPGGGEPVKGHIRLNNYLLKYIMDLLQNYRPAYLIFPLRCNPTLQNRGDHFLYLTNNNNIESFQRIPENPVVEHIAGLISEHADGVRFEDLMITLQNDIDASAEEVESYVKQLIDYGLLEYHLGVSGVDPDWDVKLIAALSPLVERKVPHIDTLVDHLAVIRKLGDQYASSNVEQRKELLQKAYDTLRESCMIIHQEAGLPEEERKTEQERLEEWKAKREEEKKKEKREEAEGKEKSENEEKKEEDEKKEEVTFKHETSTHFAFKPEQIFYEDTTREIEVKLDEKKLSKIVSDLHELLNQMRIFQGNQDEKDKMKSYFLNKYSASEPVDLLTFYEDYFREFKKPEKEREEKRKKLVQEKQAQEKQQKAEGEDNDNKEAEKPVEDKNGKDTPVEDTLSEPELPAVKERNERMEKWRKEALAQLRSSVSWNEDEINIDLDPVKRTNEKMGFGDVESIAISYGAFMQFYSDEKNAKAVVNGTFPGYGKMMSRFLHIFDNDITTQIRNWNTGQCDDNNIFIEDCDASYFNANLHPTLMPYEIWMPGGHNSLPAECQIPITDFKISYHKDGDELHLVQKSTGKRAHVFDLGFQGHMGRSQLFQLLEKFTKAEYLFTHPLTNLVNQLNQPEQPEKEAEKPEKDTKNPAEGEVRLPSISVQPRIIYKDTLVLQRKSWFVPKPLLPVREPNESDWQFFRKVNIWRKENNMPDEVFVFVNPSRWNDNVNPDLMKKLTRDDYKPQYIDFTNPLVVNLLEKLMDRVPVNMKVVEMLPASKQMLRVDNSKFVSEFVIQWYNNNLS